MTELDRTDQGILSLLRADARLPVVELAKRLKVSRATVQNRMRRLEEAGVIRAYTVEIADETESPAVRALMSIRAESSDEASVIRRLRGNPHVAAVHHTT
ncbi:MAG: winged helix-turn-helix transcriptional regulator, partial [Gammaproteobacteria bacterium]|nr:winged helix-turn-helix transcriptional regulator [Gammaproteobacteria bacterium]